MSESSEFEKKTIIQVTVVLIVLLFFVFVLNKSHSVENRFVEAQIGTHTVVLEVVDTPDSRVKGLSGREKLKEGTGMLFVFDEVGIHSIWMKDMLFSIDIVWARPSRGSSLLANEDSNGIDEVIEIVHVEENVSPESFPASFRSNIPAKYVIELESGFLETKNVLDGDIVSLLDY